MEVLFPKITPNATIFRHVHPPFQTKCCYLTLMRITAQWGSQTASLRVTLNWEADPVLHSL